jgi:glycosyltransferase involved in cell wall biosynthesis
MPSIALLEKQIMNNSISTSLAVSVIVHCLNEEINLPHALKSVCGRFSEVFVVDAGSIDRTKEIALSYGANFVQIEGNRSTLVKQRNWALDNLPIKNEWVYILDADETVPNDLFEEISERVNNPLPNVDAYWVRYKEIFLNRWVKRSAIYPNWNLRLFKRHIARYEDRTVNAHVKIDHSRTLRLKAHFIHDDKRGISAYLKRLSQITIIEAISLNELYTSNGNLLKGRLFSPSSVERRRALKKLFYYLPFRPLLMFFYLYIFRLGFLEGKAGLYHSLYRACQELFVNILRWERKVVRNE